MKNVLSDHLLYWSDINEKQIKCVSSPETKDSCKQAAASRCYSSRFLDQALQTVWQARLQVCTRPRSWSQVLPVCQPTWRQTANGLRPPGLPGASRRVCSKFSQDKRAFGENLRNQPGTAPSEGTPVDVLPGSLHRRHGDNHFRQPDGTVYSSCQYARVGSTSRLRQFFAKGGPGR